METLSTREWSFVIWVVAAICYLVWVPNAKDAGKSLKEVLKALWVRPIISIFLLMTIYVSVIVYLYSQLELWEWHQFKNTVIWYFAVASLSLLKLGSLKESPNHLKDTVINNIKLIGIIEFLTGVYTFNILVEIALVPLMFILGAMIGISQTDKKYESVEKFLNNILLVVGSLIVFFTLYMMVSDISQLAKEEKVYDFFVPPLLTLAYIPFMIFMTMYTAYENVFIRLRFFVKGSFLRLYAKLITMIRFNVRTSLLERWAANLAVRDVRSVSDINESISHIFEMVATEKNPRKIDINEGWSPYEAKDYLLSEGVETRYYHPVDESEWWCGSDLVEIGNGLFKNNIAYYVSGDSKVAKSLKIKVNVNSPDDYKDAHRKFLSASSALLNEALGIELPAELKESIVKGCEDFVYLSGVRLGFTKQQWGSHAFGGYDISFELSRV